MDALLHFVLDLIHRAGYLGVFVVMVLGNVGVPVGTEIVVPAAGALAAKGLLSSWWLAALAATAGEVVGAGILYGVGYFGGRPFVERYGKFVGLNLHKLDMAHGFYERYGTKMVFLGRFIPVIRGIASLPAGISRMQKRYFFTYTALGSAIFCFALAYAGNRLGAHFSEIMPLIHRFTLLIVLIVVAAASVAVYRWNSTRKQPI